MQESSRMFTSTDDVPCVWMRAGILSYQLCNREYDCYDCPLDHALREHFSRESFHHAAFGKPVLQHESVSLREEYLYSHQHCWIQRNTNGTVRVGIEPRLARVLLIPKSIVLPPQGQVQKKAQASVWIILEQGTFPIASPLDGVIVARNSVVSEQPSEALSHPFDDGWLYEMTCTTNDNNSLMNHVEAKLQYDHDMRQFNELVVDELKSNSSIGQTLADGGVMLQHVADMLGQKKYMKILRAVFG